MWDSSWQVLILNVALEKLTWIGNSNCLHVKGSHLVSFRCYENPRFRCQKISYILCSDSLGIFALGGKTPQICPFFDISNKMEIDPWQPFCPP